MALRRIHQRVETAPAIFWSALLALGLAGPDLFGAVQEEFESASPTWEIGSNDCHLRLHAHRRVFDLAHSGSGSEYIQFWAARGGTEALIKHRLEPALVIDELTAALWVKSPRGGYQLSVRVVLPRSIDPATGKPLSRLLQGTTYDEPGKWQQLRVENLKPSLETQTRLLRTVYGPSVDDAEAYIDTIVLNTYAGDGLTELWVDDLEMTGFAGRVEPPHRGPDAATQVAGGANEPPPFPDIEVSGSLVLVNGKAFFARVVEWSGEPFSFLSDIGFNTVRLPTQPTHDQTREAARLNLWIISPPPGQAAANGVTHRTLCWHIGDQLASHDLVTTASTIAALRLDSATRRVPVVCDVVEDMPRFAEHSDIVQITSAPIATSFELMDCAPWWRQRATNVRPVKPFWAAIQTELSTSHQLQLRTLIRDQIVETDVEPEQLWMQTLLAISAGARGVVFRSQSRLDGQDRSSRRRAAAIRVMNDYLRILEPWCAAGTAENPIHLQKPGIFATSLARDRSRLFFLCRAEAEQQYLVGAESDNTQLVVPLPSRHIADQAWEITPGELRRLPSTLAAAGSISIREPNLFSLIVLTSDPLVVNYLGRNTDATRSRIVKDLQTICVLQLDETREVLRRLSDRGYVSPKDETKLAFIESSIEEGRRLQHAGDTASAARMLDTATATLRALRKVYWRNATLEFPSPISSPLCTSFRTLGSHRDLAERMQHVSWGPNAMAAGGFESLPHLLATRWSQSSHAIPRVEAKTELSLEAPYTGRYALKLQSWSATPPTMVERWPVWITSSPIPIRAGQMYRIRGAARVDEEVIGSSDGLMIFDTMTGTELATRIRKTRGWREFTLFRAAPHSGEFSVVIALTGIGSAFVDDLEVIVGSFSDVRNARRIR